MKTKSKIAAIPYLVWMLVFIIIPLGLVLFFGFTTKGGEFTFDNFTNIVKYAHVFWKSIYLSVIATAICLVLAFPLGFLMSRMSEVGQRTMLMLIMLPMWMSFLLRTYGWMTLLENEGLINRFLGLFGPRENLVFPWNQVHRFGQETVLIEGTPRPLTEGEKGRHK